MRIAYLLPSTKISGGISIILQHTNELLKRGHDVFLLSNEPSEEIEWFPNQVPIIHTFNSENLDILVATFWATVNDAIKIRSKRKFYFVQSDERLFYRDLETRIKVHQTYVKCLEFLTEAKWIQEFLKIEFHHDSYYIPNGIDPLFFYKTNFEPHPKRILLEGAIDLELKGVEIAYEAVKDLNCEIWMVSNSGKPKPHWKISKFFENVQFLQMKNIYSSCDVLLKMSLIEGLSGPPLEAMACGCPVVLGHCKGYEYIIPNWNGVIVPAKDIIAAKKAVLKILFDDSLRNKLIKNGYETAKKWSWDSSMNKLEEIFIATK